MEGGKPENPEKNPQSRTENQQQTQPTCDARSGNRTRATAMGGECSHHCAIPALTVLASAYTDILFFSVILQGKGTCKTYWLISAVKRASIKVNKLLHPNGQPLMNYLNTPGHHFGSNSSLNLKRTDSLRRSMKGSSPNPVKKSWHKGDDESAALLNQTSVWPLYASVERFPLILYYW